MNVSILSVLFVVLSLSVAAQKNFVDGYIVKKNGDSLRGQIDYRDWGSNPQQIDFLDARGNPLTLGTDDLLAFGVGADRYECHRVHIFPYSIRPETLISQEDVGSPYDTTVFLQVVISGKLTLWEYRLPTGVNYYFINGAAGRPDQLRVITWVSNVDGTTHFQQQEVFKNQLTAVMGDCEAVQGKIARTAYMESSLRNLVFSYNNCGKDTVEGKVEGRSHGGAVRFFPIAGYVTSQVKFGGSGDPVTGEHFAASGGIVAGAGALFILPRKREQFAIVADVIWQHFHSVSDTGQASSYITDVGHMDYSLVELEVLLRYSYPSGKVRPFIEAGMANGSAFNFNCYQVNYDHVYNSTSVYNTDMLGGGLRHYQNGWILGAGVSGRHWGVEGRWETSEGISSTIETSSRTNSWFVVVSYYL